MLEAQSAERSVGRSIDRCELRSSQVTALYVRLERPFPRYILSMLYEYRHVFLHRASIPSIIQSIIARVKKPSRMPCMKSAILQADLGHCMFFKIKSSVVVSNSYFIRMMMDDDPARIPTILTPRHSQRSVFSRVCVGNYKCILRGSGKGGRRLET